MKYEAEVKDVLIENTIKLLAEGGFERATVKELAHSGGSVHGVKMNDVYVYRLFGGKENLFAAAFARLDGELYSAIGRASAETGGFPIRDKERLYRFFIIMWNFLLDNKSRFLAYIRYYYSIYCSGPSRQAHNDKIHALADGARDIFKEDADVVAILHSVFISFIDFGFRVLVGDVEDSEESRPHIFNVLYCMMATYFKDSPDLPVGGGT